MHLITPVVCFLLLVSADGIFQCPSEVNTHARAVVENICGKFDGIEEFIKFVKCHKETGTDVRLAFTKCSEELGIENAGNPEVAFQHVCKQASLEKRVSTACCAMTRAAEILEGGIKKLIQNDKECWKILT